MVSASGQFEGLVVGIDLSTTGLGLVCVPHDWGCDWSRVERISLGTKPGSPLPGRRRALANDVVMWVSHQWGSSAKPIWLWHEGYPLKGGAYNIDLLCELGGVVKDALYTQLGLLVEPAPLESARKLFLGKLPQRGRKQAVASAMSQITDRFNDGDQIDAFVAANWGLYELGLPFVAVQPVESVKVSPVRKRGRRRVA